MITVNIHDMPPQMQPLLAQILAGESVTLCEGDKPVIEMKPLAAPIQTPAKKGRMLGNPPFPMVIPDDIDKPLPEEIWNMFNGYDDKHGL